MEVGSPRLPGERSARDGERSARRCLAVRSVRQPQVDQTKGKDCAWLQDNFASPARPSSGMPSRPSAVPAQRGRGQDSVEPISRGASADGNRTLMRAASGPPVLRKSISATSFVRSSSSESAASSASTAFSASPKATPLQSSPIRTADTRGRAYNNYRRDRCLPSVSPHEALPLVTPHEAEAPQSSPDSLAPEPPAESPPDDASDWIISRQANAAEIAHQRAPGGGNPPRSARPQPLRSRTFRHLSVASLHQSSDSAPSYATHISRPETARITRSRSWSHLSVDSDIVAAGEIAGMRQCLHGVSVTKAMRSPVSRTMSPTELLQGKWPSKFERTPSDPSNGTTNGGIKVEMRISRSASSGSLSSRDLGLKSGFESPYLERPRDAPHFTPAPPRLKRASSTASLRRVTSSPSRQDEPAKAEDVTTHGQRVSRASSSTSAAEQDEPATKVTLARVLSPLGDWPKPPHSRCLHPLLWVRSQP